MKALPVEVMRFLEKQRVFIVSTLNEHGRIHCSAKGIVGFEPEGKIYVMDLYLKKTFRNLKRNPMITLTSVDENAFEGYSFQGNAKIVEYKDIQDHLMEKWTKRLIRRIADRLIRNVQSEKPTGRHYEAELPHMPKYLIEIDVEHIVSLTPVRQKD